MKEICERIQAECKRTGQPLARVMAQAGLQISIFYKWKKGGTQARPDSLAAIAKVLKVPPEYLAPELGNAFHNVRHRQNPAGELGDELVFVGLPRSALTLLRPFIEHVDAKLVEVPANLGRGLAALMRRPIAD